MNVVRWSSLTVFAVVVACDDPFDPINDGPSVIEVVGGDQQSARVATALPEMVRVRVADAGDRPVAAAAVSFAVISGGGSVDPNEVITDNEGLARTTWTLGTSTVDSQVLEARAARANGSIISIRAHASAVAGPPFVLAPITADSIAAQPGAAVPVSARVQDAYGNPVAGVLAEISVTSGGGSVSAGGGESNANGEVATVWILGVAGNQILEMRAADVAPLLFHAVLPTPAAPDGMVFYAKTIQFGPVQDVRGGRVFFTLFSATSGTPGICCVRVGWHDVAQGIESFIPRQFEALPGALFGRSDGGVVFSINTIAENRDTLYHWVGGVLHPTSDPSARLELSGDFAIYTGDAGGTWPLIRRNLVTSAEIVVRASSYKGDRPPGAGTGAWADVAANGDVVYTALLPDTAVMRFRDGITTPIGIAGDRDPLTDGVNVVFSRRSGEIGLFDGTAVHTLASARVRVTAHRDYAVNAGWAAFTREGGTIWTRSPSGVEQQVPAVTGAFIDALGNDGTVVVLVEGVTRERHIARPGTAPVHLGFGGGRTIWRDGEFYVLTGNTVYRITAR